MNECKYVNCIKPSAKSLLGYCQLETIWEVFLPPHPHFVQPASRYLFPVSRDNAYTVAFDLGALMIPNAVAISVCVFKSTCLHFHRITQPNFFVWYNGNCE